MPFSRKSFAAAQFVLLFVALSLLLGACRNGFGRSGPTPFPTSTRPPTATPTLTPAPTETAAGTSEHTIDAAGFTILLPAGWVVAEQGLTPLGHYYLLGPEPLDPGPHSSTIFVAEAEELSALGAAALLLCGGGCEDEIELAETTVAGNPAESAVIASEDGAALTWYFMEHERWLIYLSLHDPVTLGDRPDLLETIRFVEPTATPTATATASPTPSATPSATPLPTLQPVRAWRRVAPAEAGLSFEVPAGWAQAGLTWMPAEEHPSQLGFQWQLVGDEAWQAESFFPAGAEAGAAGPVPLSWAPEASRYPLEVAGGVASYVIVPAEERVYAFHARAEDAAALAELEPVLQHVLDSVRLEFVIEIPLATPSDAAIGFFEAVITDPGGSSALVYLSPALRREVPAVGAPLNLLQLDGRLLEYNLDWQFTADDTVLMTAAITLQDGSSVVRELTLVNFAEIGWRITAIVVPEEE